MIQLTDSGEKNVKTGLVLISVVRSWTMKLPSPLNPWGSVACLISKYMCQISHKYLSLRKCPLQSREPGELLQLVHINKVHIRENEKTTPKYHPSSSLV